MNANAETKPVLSVKKTTGQGTNLIRMEVKVNVEWPTYSLLCLRGKATLDWTCIPVRQERTRISLSNTIGDEQLELVLFGIHQLADPEDADTWAVAIENPMTIPAQEFFQRIRTHMVEIGTTAEETPAEIDGMLPTWKKWTAYPILVFMLLMLPTCTKSILNPPVPTFQKPPSKIEKTWAKEMKRYFSPGTIEGDLWAPEVSNLSAGNVSYDSATVEFVTDEPARVIAWQNNSVAAEDTFFLENHLLKIRDLESGTANKITLELQDPNGNKSEASIEIKTKDTGFFYWRLWGITPQENRTVGNYLMVILVAIVTFLAACWIIGAAALDKLGDYKQHKTMGKLALGAVFQNHAKGHGFAPMRFIEALLAEVMVAAAKIPFSSVNPVKK